MGNNGKARQGTAGLFWMAHAMSLAGSLRRNHAAMIRRTVRMTHIYGLLELISETSKNRVSPLRWPEFALQRALPNGNPSAVKQRRGFFQSCPCS
jgi:hypothetical protein